MGRPAAADPIDPGGRDRPDRVGRNSSRRLEDDLRAESVADRDPGGQAFGRHVVEKNDVGARFEDGRELVERIEFNLHHRRRGALGGKRPGDEIPGPTHRRGRIAPGSRHRREVVVLDENCVIETDPVGPATASPGGIFVEEPPAGNRLAGVVDPAVRPGHRIDEPAGGRGHPRHPAEDVEHRPFGGEDAPGRADEPGHNRPPPDTIAVVCRRRPLQPRIDPRRDDPRGRQPRHHAPGPGDDVEFGSGLGRDE